MIQSGKREKKIFLFFLHGKRIDLTKKDDFEGTSESEINSATIYGYKQDYKSYLTLNLLFGQWAQRK